MRNLLIICTFAICMFASLAQAAELKIGVFNMEKVGNDSTTFKELQTEWESKFGNEGRALQKQNTDLENEFKKLASQQQALSAEAREDRQMELSLQKRALDDKTNNFMRKANTAENSMREELIRVVLYAVREIGKRDKYTMILEQQTAGAIVVGDAVNIDKIVLDEVNKVWKNKPKDLFPAGK